MLSRAMLPHLESRKCVGCNLKVGHLNLLKKLLQQGTLQHQPAANHIPMTTCFVTHCLHGIIAGSKGMQQAAHRSISQGVKPEV